MFETLVAARMRGGLTTVLNPSPVPRRAEELARLRQHLSFASLLVLNEIEAEQLCDLKVTDVPSAFAASDALIALGASTVLLTLGANGAVVVDGKSTRSHVPSPKVTVVDTTGAGDSFLGALVFFLSQETELVESARRACIVAGISVQKEGCQPSYPNLAAVQHLF